jgi:hypothetical protein
MKSDPALIESSVGGEKSIRADLDDDAVDAAGEPWHCSASRLLITSRLKAVKRSTLSPRSYSRSLRSNAISSTQKCSARFSGSKLDRLEAKHPWIDRPSLFMVGEHVTLGGEADAETELDVSDAREKSATSKAGTGLVHTLPVMVTTTL